MHAAAGQDSQVFFGTLQINTSLDYIRKESIPGSGRSAACQLHSGEMFLLSPIATAALWQNAETCCKRGKKVIMQSGFPPPTHLPTPLTIITSRLQPGSHDLWSMALFPAWLRTHHPSVEKPKTKNYRYFPQEIGGVKQSGGGGGRRRPPFQG